MYKNLLITLLFVALFLTTAHSTFVPNRVVPMPNDIFEIDYSPKQVFLGAATRQMFVLYEGHTGKELQRINIDTSLALNSFGFSHDNKWLALGLNNGSVKLYQYDSATKKFLEDQLKFKADIESEVTGLCFSSDNNFIVIGLRSDQIVVWDIIQDISVDDDFDLEFILTVSCSPTKNQFAVGGGQNIIAQLALFQIDSSSDNATINRLHNFDDPTNSTPYGTTFSSEGDILYSVGKNATITAFNLTTYGKTNIPVQGLTEPLSKIRVSDNGLVIAVVTNTLDNYKIYVLNNSQSLEIEQISTRRQLFMEDFDMDVDEIIVGAVEIKNSVIPSVALSPTSTNILYLKSANTGQIEGVCEQSFYLDSSGCQACNSNCTICQSSATECYECQGARYLDNNNLCLDCIVGCVKCEDGLTCQQCDTSAHFIIDNETKCVCEPAFFKNDTDECQECIDSCIQCDNAETCITCDASKGFIEEGGKCVCGPGFFNETGACVACIRGCQECSNRETCVTCFEDRHFILSNDTCICNGPQHFIDDGQNCVCEPSYYLESGKCEKCRLGCSDCTAIDECTGCLPGLHIQNKICVCDNTGDYIDIDSTCKPCIEVLQFCDACLSATQCTQCQAGLDRHLQNGACPCDDGFYPDQTTKVCLQCQQVGCKKCEGPDECSVCNDIDHWIKNDTTGECQCMDDYVQQNITCVDCPDGCKHCNPGDLQCTECQVNWVLDGQGGCKCTSGYYQENRTCLECMAGCIDCTQVEVCNECDVSQFFILNQTTQTCVCLSGFYLSQRQCLQCSQSIKNCLECSSANVCTKCSNPFMVVGSGSCGCEKGKYVDGIKCSICQEGCVDCTGAQQCTKCDDSHTLDGGVCKKDGLDTLIIVLIVIGVLAVAGGVFALVKCVKKKRSPLSEDYEEL